MSTTKLSTCAMQVGFAFGCPRQQRQLKNEESRIESENNAQPGTVKASGYYFKHGKIDGLDPLKVFQRKMRKALEHYARYPYLPGTRILPAAVVEPFLKVKAEFDAQVDTVWMNWADEVYPEWSENAPDRMGKLYDKTDFPSLADCKARFRNDIRIVPIGEVEQVQRISLLAPDITALVTQSAADAHLAAVRNTAAKNFNDVMGPIQNIVKVLSNDKGRLFDSMIENLVSIVDMVPALNITGDQHLIDLAAQAKERLCNISVDDLRESGALRAKTLASAQTIINQFQPYARSWDDDKEETTNQ